MADPAPQNYSNHVFVPKSLIVLSVLFLIAAILGTAGLVLTGSTAGTCLIGTAVVLQAIIGVFGLLMARGYAVRLQDRIIRTEMRIRLAEVLPDELKAAATKLTIKQLIGLRFASDEELPDLTRKVLDENIQKADAIKRLVTDWQGDYDRV